MGIKYLVGQYGCFWVKILIDVIGGFKEKLDHALKSRKLDRYFGISQIMCVLAC